ncbi:MAG: winged helix-turn-helix domain-containing protein [Candidatus Eremiobacteraeota bacterium]|nr:winged helix-turn-helix domain-containing protein [Candidatus Eremiobacteraeota bacterium]
MDVHRSYQFGPFRLDQRTGSVWQGSEEVHLTAKAFSTLLLLVENAGSLVSKETLLERVWPEGFIEPANVTQTVYIAAQSLGRRQQRQVVHRHHRW